MIMHGLANPKSTTNLQSKQKKQLSTSNSYMFRIAGSIIGQIKDLSAGKMQLLAENTANRCVYCGIPHHINTIIINF